MWKQQHPLAKTWQKFISATIPNILIFFLINELLKYFTSIFYCEDFTSAVLLPVNLVEENYGDNIPEIPPTLSDTYHSGSKSTVVKSI